MCFIGDEFKETESSFIESIVVSSSCIMGCGFEDSSFFFRLDLLRGAFFFVNVAVLHSLCSLFLVTAMFNKRQYWGE